MNYSIFQSRHFFIASKLLFFLTVPKLGGFSHDIYYFPSLVSHSSNNFFFSFPPPSTVPCSFKDKKGD